MFSQVSIVLFRGVGKVSLVPGPFLITGPMSLRGGGAGRVFLAQGPILVHSLMIGYTEMDRVYLMGAVFIPARYGIPGGRV